jgi:hypothetical protein
LLFMEKKMIYLLWILFDFQNKNQLKN